MIDRRRYTDLLAYADPINNGMKNSCDVRVRCKWKISFEEFSIQRTNVCIICKTNINIINNKHTSTAYTFLNIKRERPDVPSIHEKLLSFNGTYLIYPVNFIYEILLEM